jgi:hypothetical protein
MAPVLGSDQPAYWACPLNRGNLIVHSLVYLDFRYIYVKFPFMLWFAGYLINDCFKTVDADKKPPAWIFAVFAMSSLLGTALLVF